MPKKIYIIANWKMNPPTFKEAERLLSSIITSAKSLKVNLVFCPPFVWLAKLIEKKSNKNILWGAQNIFWEKEKGAFTGEVSAAMIYDLGCKYIIIGHSERKKYFNENDKISNLKVKAALAMKLMPVVCIGEEFRERDEFGKSILSAKIIETQLKACLKDVGKNAIDSIIVVYEPRWAIGTGFADTPESTFEVIIFIRRILAQLYGEALAKKVLILYGGSISAANAGNFISRGGVDGLLVGGASIRAKEFIEIIKNVSNI